MTTLCGCSCGAAWLESLGRLACDNARVNYCFKYKAAKLWFSSRKKLGTLHDRRPKVFAAS